MGDTTPNGRYNSLGRYNSPGRYTVASPKKKQANTLNPKKRVLWRSCQNHSKLGVPLWLDINKPLSSERIERSDGLSFMRHFTHLPDKELD